MSRETRQQHANLEYARSLANIANHTSAMERQARLADAAKHLIQAGFEVDAKQTTLRVSKQNTLGLVRIDAETRYPNFSTRVFILVRRVKEPKSKAVSLNTKKPWLSELVTEVERLLQKRINTP